MLGDIYALGEAAIPDAPLIGFGDTFKFAVGIFENVEALAFYAGFLFGIFWVIKKGVQNRKSVRGKKGDKLIQTINELNEKEEEDNIEQSSEIDLPSQSKGFETLENDEIEV
jgi:hypothetical protein